jgi:nitroreductase
MMDFSQVLRDRRSIRRYENRPVPKETISKLIDAAEAAPSAGNLRARKYVIITRKEMGRALAMAAYGQSQVEAAPLLIVVCADVDRSASRYGDRGSLYAIQDADAAAMCLLLSAHDLGLGACWNGAFDDQIVREALSLEEHVLPVAIISVGWPAEMPRAPPKRGLEEMVAWVE